MKKTSLFLSIISLISVACLSIPLIRANKTSFSIKDINGDRSTLNGVSFESYLNVNDTYVVTSFDGTTNQQHNIRKHYDVIEHPYTSLHYDCEDDCNVMSDWTVKAGDNSNHTDYIRKLGQTSIYLDTQGSDIPQGYISFKTDLYYEADDEHQIIQYGTATTNTEKEIRPIGPITATFPEPSRIQSNIDFQKDDFYIVPFSNQYMKGQNYIYHIKRNKSQTSNNQKDKAYTIEKLKKLDMSYNYLGIRLFSDYFLLFSEKDHQLHLTKYDHFGNVKGDIILDGTQTSEQVFQNDVYMNFIHNDTLYVLNTATMQIAENIDISNIHNGKKPHEIDDILYQNEKLYTLWHSIDPNANYNALIQVNEHENTLYTGTIAILSTREYDPSNEYSFYYPFLVPFQFKR